MYRRGRWMEGWPVTELWPNITVPNTMRALKREYSHRKWPQIANRILPALLNFWRLVISCWTFIVILHSWKYFRFRKKNQWFELVIRSPKKSVPWRGIKPHSKIIDSWHPLQGPCQIPIRNFGYILAHKHTHTHQWRIFIVKFWTCVPVQFSSFSCCFLANLGK